MMTADESLRRFGIVPNDAALAEIRSMLASEIEAERRGEERQDDLALLCCVQLFSRGLLEDVLRIWEAKRASMDLDSAVDVQFLCGAGVEETRKFLATQTGARAQEILRRIGTSIESGDFDGFTPGKYLERYKRYFGVV